LKLTLTIYKSMKLIIGKIIGLKLLRKFVIDALAEKVYRVLGDGIVRSYY
jgi:hypothetical protein